MCVHESMNGYLPSSLNNNFIYLHNLHGYNTRGSSQFQVKLPKINTHVYGCKYISSISYYMEFNYIVLQNLIVKALNIYIYIYVYITIYL